MKNSLEFNQKYFEYPKFAVDVHFFCFTFFLKVLP